MQSSPTAVSSLLLLSCFGEVPLLSGSVRKNLFVSAPRTPPTLTLPLKGGGNCGFIAIPYTSPLEGEVGAQRREGGWRTALKDLCLPRQVLA